jgi:hypothetical protein
VVTVPEERNQEMDRRDKTPAQVVGFVLVSKVVRTHRSRVCL